MKTVVLTERDTSLLRSLWRWKLLSTATITEAFFPDRSPITAYVRLWHLKEGNFIQLISEPGGKAFYWCLASKGFSAIQSELPELAEAGFKSENLKHDHLVTVLDRTANPQIRNSVRRALSRAGPAFCHQESLASLAVALLRLAQGLQMATGA